MPPCVCGHSQRYSVLFEQGYTTEHRYSDFAALLKDVLSLFPHLSWHLTPLLPRKLWWHSYEAVLARTRQLTHLLHFMLAEPLVGSCAPLSLFLTGSTDTLRIALLLHVSPSPISYVTTRSIAACKPVGSSDELENVTDRSAVCHAATVMRP